MMLDRLTVEDALVLGREAGAVCGHTCKVLILRSAGGRSLPELETLRRHIDARLDAAPRLRQRLVATPLRVANPVRLDDPAFDVARHVTQVQTDGPVSRSGLEEIVGRLMAQRLDRAHPLWRIDVVELDDESMALVWRVHHCMADGTTCVRLGSAVLWREDPGTEDAVVGTSPAPAWTPVAGPGAMRLFALGVADRARHTRGHPHGPRAPQDRLRATRAVIKRELARDAEPTPLAVPIGRRRNVAFAQAPLAESKLAGKAIAESVTLNDVVLAIVAGGLRTWLEHGSGPTAGIRVKVPVSLHASGEEQAVAANRDSYFFVDLPVAEPDPAKRVLAISRETRERKHGHDAETLYHLGRHPVLAHWAMSPPVFTFNVSNVRGPADDVYVCGARVSEFYSLAEIAQRHALRVAVISAAGRLSFGLCSDSDAVRDLELLTDGLRRSRDELLALAA
jgi:diacylglycerol O-acyltransferase